MVSVRQKGFFLKKKQIKQKKNAERVEEKFNYLQGKEYGKPGHHLRRTRFLCGGVC